MGPIPLLFISAMKSDGKTLLGAPLPNDFSARRCSTHTIESDREAWANSGDVPESALAAMARLDRAAFL